MELESNYFKIVRSFLEYKIIIRNVNSALLEVRNNSLKLSDKLGLHIKVTFIFWKGSDRVTILIEDHEIMDEEFISYEDLIRSIDCLISNEVLKTEKFVRNKLIHRQYKYSMMVNGKQEKVKDESRFGFSLFFKPLVKVSRFLPW